MNIIRNWKGYYEYGVGYRLPHFGKRVNINVTLKGSNERFIGLVTEEESEFSVPLQATIEGFSEGDLISFIKSYPKRPSLKEHGNTDLQIENGSLKIEHEGIIDAQNNSLYGSWSIFETVIDELGSFESASHGIWMLEPSDY